MFKKLFISLLLAFCLAGGVDLTLQEGVNGYSGCEDSYISNQSSSSNYGDRESLNLKYEKCSSWSGTILYKTRAVIKFDFKDSLPDSAIVLEARLSLQPTRYQNFTNGSKSLYTLDDSWSEERITWKNVPDFGNIIDNVDTLDEFDVTKVIKDVESNNGFLIKMDDYTNGINYHSSESDSIEARPKLTIVYDVPTNIKYPVNKVTKKPCRCMMVDMMGRRIRRAPTNKIYFIINKDRVIKHMDLVR